MKRERERERGKKMRRCVRATRKEEEEEVEDNLFESGVGKYF